MPCANARHAARQNLPAFLHELGRSVGALVVDEVHFLDAELANFLLAKILAFAPGPPPGTARATAPRPAFAPRTAVSPAGPVASMTTAAFTPRRSAGRWCLFLFLCHTFHPFTDRPTGSGSNIF